MHETCRREDPSPPERNPYQRNLNGIENRSCAAVMPAGGLGYGDARRTAESAARARAESQFDRAMRAERRLPERESEKLTTTRHLLPLPRGR
jgi:hypothetical protein